MAKYRIMFVCHGNICRSPMAEFVFRDIVSKAGAESRYTVASSATHYDEIGNGVYPPTKRELAKLGINADNKRAVKLYASDYDLYDYFIGMDDANIRNMTSMFSGDREGKVKKLLSFAGSNRDVDDPWYSRDFSRATADILAGCKGLFDYLEGKQ